MQEGNEKILKNFSIRLRLPKQRSRVGEARKLRADPEGFGLFAPLAAMASAAWQRRKRDYMQKIAWRKPMRKKKRRLALLRPRLAKKRS